MKSTTLMITETSAPLPAMPASPGRSFFQIIHRISPTRGMKKPRTAQTEGACVGGSSPIGCRGLRVYGVELAAHSSAARRLVAVARIEIGWVKRIGLAVTAGLAARRRAVVVGLDMVLDCSSGFLLTILGL